MRNMIQKLLLILSMICYVNQAWCADAVIQAQILRIGDTHPGNCPQGMTCHPGDVPDETDFTTRGTGWPESVKCDEHENLAFVSFLYSPVAKGSHGPAYGEAIICTSGADAESYSSIRQSQAVLRDWLKKSNENADVLLLLMIKPLRK